MWSLDALAAVEALLGRGEHALRWPGAPTESASDSVNG
jgi:hypothetical protein